jgi:hypothetical protein
MFPRDSVVRIVREAMRTPTAVPGVPAPGPIDLGLVVLGLTPVLADIGPESVDAVLELIGSVGHADLRALLLEYVERVLPGNETRIVEGLLLTDIEMARKLMRRLASLRSQAAIDALRRLSMSSSPPHRCEAVALLAGSPDELRDSLFALSESSEAEVRSAALRTLAHHRVGAAGPLLVKKIQESSFQALSIAERRDVLGALWTLHPARAEVIAIEVAQKHGIIPDAALDETRVVAIELLGGEGKSVEALEGVLSATKRRWWNGPPVRDAAMIAATAIAARVGKRINASGEIE